MSLAMIIILSDSASDLSMCVWVKMCVCMYEYVCVCVGMVWAHVW